MASLAKAKMEEVTWGFIGLGNIGYPMAANLREKMPRSHNLVVMDVNDEAVKRFIAEATTGPVAVPPSKVQTAKSAREVAERSTVLITCLPSVQIVKDLYQEILDAPPLPPLEQKRLFIDTSTIDPRSSRTIAKDVQEATNSYFVDAPVSGGVLGARSGTLSFMFGAPDSARLLERIETVLLTMGKKTWHMGPSGAGVCSKLANNYLLSITSIAASEALNMGRQSGLNPKALSDLIQSSTGRCWFLEANNPVPGVDENAPASKGYEPGGSVNIVKKDLGLAIDGAKAFGAALPLAEKALEVYQKVSDFDGNKDFSIIYQWLKSQSSA